MSFRDNLQHLRATRNMTQEQLAMLLGVSRQSVSKWEAERAYPEMDKLIKLCALFECTLDELVQGDLTDRPADSTASVPAGAPPQDVTGYDEAMRSFALRIPLAAAVALGSMAAATLAGGIANAFGGYAASAAALLLYLGPCVGVVLAVAAAMSRRAFRSAHPFVEDFYTPEQKSQARSAQTTGLVAGLCLIAAGCVVPFPLQGNAWFATAASLACLAAAAFFLLRGWLLGRRCDVARYNDASLYRLDDEGLDALDDESLQLRARRVRRERSTYILVMSVATAVGLVLAFIPVQPVQEMFPLAWPVGILVCVAIRAARTMRVG